MQVIPAIDLINGCPVRLTKGAFDSPTVYGSDPGATARRFAQAGAGRLHVVDLDAARGSGNNLEAIKQIRRAFPGVLQVGGGVRSLAWAEKLRDCGVDFLVAGTILVREPAKVKEWVSRLGPVFWGGIDAWNGNVKVGGWLEGSPLTAAALAGQAKEMGLVGIIYTDIAQDGTLAGPSKAETQAVAEAAGLPVILSGGMGSPADVESLSRDFLPGITGVIIGKALYEGRIDLAQAIETLEKGEGKK